MSDYHERNYGLSISEAKEHTEIDCCYRCVHRGRVGYIDADVVECKYHIVDSCRRLHRGVIIGTHPWMPCGEICSAYSREKNV